MDNNYLIPYDEDFLMHYGVLGMKWGVHRSIRKANRISTYRKKALKKETTAEKYKLKALKNADKSSEKNQVVKTETVFDSSNNPHQKMTISYKKSKGDTAKYLKNKQKSGLYGYKSSIASKKAQQSTDGRRYRLERKADKYGLKSTKYNELANIYGEMYSSGSKSGKYKKKAARSTIRSEKYKYRIKRNSAYIKRIQEKVSGVDDAKKQLGKDVVKRLMSLEYDK